MTAQHAGQHDGRGTSLEDGASEPATHAPRAPRTRPGATVRWIGLLACAWMLLFAGFHAYWAFGGTLGLPPGESLVDNTPLFVIDLIAIPMNLGGALFALALVHEWGLRLRRRMLLVGAWGCAGLFVFHALPAVPDLVMHLTGTLDEPLDNMERFSVLLYEPFWMVGGLLFTVLAWSFQRRTRQTADRAPLQGS